MENIRVIKGNLSVSDKILDLYPSALKFYGNSYERVINSTLRNTVVYEWNDESPSQIVSDVLKRPLSLSEISKVITLDIGVEGFHFLINKNFTEVNHIAVIRNNPDEEHMKSVIAHEIYGHAVCSEVMPYVIMNRKLNERNGIAFSDVRKHTVINRMANEGMIEYIANQIMNIYCGNGESKSLAYKKQVEVAKILFEYIDKETLLDLLVLNTSNINILFDDMNEKSWDKVSERLDKKNPRVDKYMNSFIKRHSL